MKGNKRKEGRNKSKTEGRKERRNKLRREKARRVERHEEMSFQFTIVERKT